MIKFCVAFVKAIFYYLLGSILIWCITGGIIVYLVTKVF